MKWNAYWRLMRFDKPAGLFLLWYPTAIGLWLANQGSPPLKLLLLFVLGTILMRAAGCIINDLADRNIDKFVSRTSLRPITSGELSLLEAFMALYVLLYLAFMILTYINPHCFIIAILALVITCIYPFCKRFLSAPQLVLGLAFSLGIPMAYVASYKPLDTNFYWLFLMNFIWIIIYDTMYAMADRADDLLIGVKSTAIYLGSYDRFVLAILQVILQSLWFYWAIDNKLPLLFYLFWCVSTGLMAYQQLLIRQRIPDSCFKAFAYSNYYGLSLWLGIVLTL